MSGRVLVVDDVATNRLLLRAKLSSAYYDVSSPKTATRPSRWRAANSPT